MVPFNVDLLYQPNLKDIILPYRGKHFFSFSHKFYIKRRINIAIAFPHPVYYVNWCRVKNSRKLTKIFNAFGHIFLLVPEWKSKVTQLNTGLVNLSI